MPEPSAPRFTGTYYLNGLLYQDGMPVVLFANNFVRNPGSSTNQYMAAKEEASVSPIFAPGNTSEAVVFNYPVFLYGWIGKVGTGTLTIRDSATALRRASALAS